MDPPSAGTGVLLKVRVVTNLKTFSRLLTTLPPYTAWWKITERICRLTGSTIKLTAREGDARNARLYASGLRRTTSKNCKATCWRTGSHGRPTSRAAPIQSGHHMAEEAREVRAAALGGSSHLRLNEARLITALDRVNRPRCQCACRFGSAQKRLFKNTVYRPRGFTPRCARCRRR